MMPIGKPNKRSGSSAVQQGRQALEPAPADRQAPAVLEDHHAAVACDRLDPATHLRIHRSTIVNLRRVDGLRRRGPKAMSLSLDSGADYAIGPNFVDSVLKLVNARRWR